MFFFNFFFGVSIKVCLGFLGVSLGFLWEASQDMSSATLFEQRVASSAYKTSAPPSFLNITLRLQHHKRWTPPSPVIITSHLEHPKTISPATPLNTKLHLQYHKRSTLPPPLNNTLHLEHHKRSDPPRPFERYVTSWASEDINPAPPLYNRVHLGHHKRSAPPPPLNTMLHQSHKTLTLPPLLNNTLQHKIAIPPLPLNNTLHLEHRKASITPFIWTPYCILSSARHEIRLPPLNNTLRLGHCKTSSPPPPLNTVFCWFKSYVGQVSVEYRRTWSYNHIHISM